MSELWAGLSDVELGERLKFARESAKFKQSDAAALIDVARTTMLAIEKGQRRIRMSELQILASAYGTSVNGLLRREAVYLDLVPQFRRLRESRDDGIELAGQLLNELVRAEIELEGVLGIERLRNYPPERPILPGDVEAQAEQDAQELRDWLGLGPGPVVDIISILETQLGIRVYVRPLDSRISGLFTYEERIGACMLLNSKHPLERLTQTAAHELGHFIATRRQPEVLDQNERFISKSERYANSFGRCFLAPARSVRQCFADLTAGQAHLTRRHIILLANSFGVSREAIVRRLEELKLARDGTWEWFRDNGGISNDQVSQVLGDAEALPKYIKRSQGLVPPVLSLLAREVWKLGLYSEGQLSQLLRVDRHGVREILDGIEVEESEANDFVKILR